MAAKEEGEYWVFMESGMNELRVENTDIKEKPAGVCVCAYECVWGSGGRIFVW